MFDLIHKVIAPTDWGNADRNMTSKKKQQRHIIAMISYIGWSYILENLNQLWDLQPETSLDKIRTLCKFHYQ